MRLILVDKFRLSEKSSYCVSCSGHAVIILRQWFVHLQPQVSLCYSAGNLHPLKAATNDFTEINQGTIAAFHTHAALLEPMSISCRFEIELFWRWSKYLEVISDSIILWGQYTIWKVITSKKRRGPNVAPYGTPLVTTPYLDLPFRVWTFCCLWVASNFRSFNNFPLVPMSQNFRSTIP